MIFRMKSVLALAVLLGLFCGSLSAQEFGRGRFLKKLREDFAKAKKEESDRKKEAAKQAREQKARERNRSNRNAPTPAKQNAAANSRYPNQPNARSVVTPRTLPPTAYPASAKKNASGRTGFGLTVSARKDRVVASRVDSKGNAAAAGIRSGDTILEVGGVEITTLEDFDEFTKILGQGDQMEFKINSRGKDRTVMVTFGEAPSEEEMAAADNNAGQNENFNRFVPPATNNGLGNGQADLASSRSILSRPPTNAAENNGLLVDSARVDNRTLSLQRTIESQRREIERLRREVIRLQQQVNRNTENGGTSLNGPGN